MAGSLPHMSLFSGQYQKNAPNITTSENGLFLGAVTAASSILSDFNLVSLRENPMDIVVRARKYNFETAAKWHFIGKNGDDRVDDPRQPYGLLRLKLSEQLYRGAAEYNEVYGVQVVPHPEIFADIAEAFSAAIAVCQEDGAPISKVRDAFNSKMPEVSYINNPAGGKNIESITLHNGTVINHIPAIPMTATGHGGTARQP